MRIGLAAALACCFATAALAAPQRRPDDTPSWADTLHALAQTLATVTQRPVAVLGESLDPVTLAFAAAVMATVFLSRRLAAGTTSAKIASVPPIPKDKP